MSRFKTNNTGPLVRLLAVLGAVLLVAATTSAQQPDAPEPDDGSEQVGETPGSEAKNESSTGEAAPQTAEDEGEASQPFTPSEQIRADSEVTFPADI